MLFHTRNVVRRRKYSPEDIAEVVRLRGQGLTLDSIRFQTEIPLGSVHAILRATADPMDCIKQREDDELRSMAAEGLVYLEVMKRKGWTSGKLHGRLLRAGVSLTTSKELLEKFKIDRKSSAATLD